MLGYRLSKRQVIELICVLPAALICCPMLIVGISATLWGALMNRGHAPLLAVWLFAVVFSLFMFVPLLGFVSLLRSVIFAPKKIGSASALLILIVGGGCWFVVIVSLLMGLYANPLIPVLLSPSLAVGTRHMFQAFKVIRGG